MKLTFTLARSHRHEERRWHRKRIFLRLLTIGGHGTNEPARRELILYARLWARRSISLNRWLFADHLPATERAAS